MMGSTNRTSSWLNFAQRSRDEGGLGLAPHQAAGLVGNLVNESGQDLNPWGPTGDNGTAWGTAQWRGDRLARLKARPDYQTMEGQQAFMREELDGPENKAYRALTAAASPEEAAHAWDAHYERSDGSTRDQRVQTARTLMAQFGGSNSDPAPGALTSSYAPTESKKSMPALSTENTLGPGILNSGPDGDPIASALIGIGSSLSGISNPEQAKVLAAQSAALKKQGTWSHSVMPNGQIMLSNSNGGFKVMGSPGDYSKDDSYMPVHYTDPSTGQVTLRVLNKNSGQWMDGGNNQAAQGPVMGGDPNLTGDERLKTLTPEEQRTIQGWHEGTGINPSSFVTKNPGIRKLMDAAQAVYPDMDFTKYGERNNFAKNYANKQATGFGGQIIGTEHTANLIGQQADAISGLKNSSGGWAGYGAGAANTYKDIVGGENHDTGRAEAHGKIKKGADTLSQEFQTLMTRGKGGGQAEREDQSAQINQPLAAPEVQSAPLQSMLDALKARHDEYINSARATMGDAWVEKHPDIDKKVKDNIDATQAKIDALHGTNTKKDAAPATSGGLDWAAAQKAGWK